MMLYPNHRADLTLSGINELQAMEHGFSTISDARQIGQMLNWKGSATCLGPCLAIRYFDAQGQPRDYYRLKPNYPRQDRRGKFIKYESDMGGEVHVYFPKGITEKLLDPTIPLLITEGEKKALCAFLHGLICIGVAGVQSWSRKRTKDASDLPFGERELLNDFDVIPLQDRLVYIIFDSDRVEKREVQQAEYALAVALQKQGAIVRIVSLPGQSSVDGKSRKQGLDDYLVAHGKEELISLFDSAVEPESLSVSTSWEDHFCNYLSMGNEDEKSLRTGKSIADLQRELIQRTGGWPKRVQNQLFVEEGGEIIWLSKVQDLFGWIGRRWNEKASGHPIHWKEGQGLVTQPQFFSALQQSVESFQSIDLIPHEPPLSGHYYVMFPREGGDGKSLAKLLAQFSPASEMDRELILSLFLTLVAGLKPGQRPAFAISVPEEEAAAGQGSGKTTLLRMLSKLAGGSMSYYRNESITDFLKRLCSPEGRTKRLLILDNIKQDRYGSEELEALITNEVHSGRQLNLGEGRVPNTMVWAMTLNAASLSKDLAQRVISIHLKRPVYRANWEEETSNLIDQNRWKIIGDLLARLKAPGRAITVSTRWGQWEQSVLSRVGLVSECQRVVVERQQAMNGEDEEMLLVRESIMNQISKQGCAPEKSVYFITSKKMTHLVCEALQDRFNVQAASSKIRTLGIAELRKSDRGRSRGWIWRGKSASSTAKTIHLGDAGDDGDDAFLALRGKRVNNSFDLSPKR